MTQPIPTPTPRPHDGLRELFNDRLAGRRPADLIHVTDWSFFYDFCSVNELPVLFVDPLNGQWDWRALHDLDVIVVGFNGVPRMDALKAVRPDSLRLLGPYGWLHITKVTLCK